MIAPSLSSAVQGRCVWRSDRKPVRGARTTMRASEDKPDLIESFVGRIFGKAVLEDPAPAGMKRMDPEQVPEIYPATTEEWAEPLEGDSDEVAIFRPLLAGTQLEKVPLRLAYDSAEHGWSARAFHQCVDGFGATLVVADTEGGAICGGYNPLGWISVGDDRDSIAAFLFTWPDGDITQRPYKLPKIGGPGLAVTRDVESEGPQFGPEGLIIRMTPGKEQTARSRLGAYYEERPDGTQHLFTDAENVKARGGKLKGDAQLLRLRAFVAEGDGEKWELDGVVWKTST